mmetsp:Transcript_14258/g.36750  ORF Transcript_14258/g.36750 Transcript_14258/m.36750 type:complete len:456 (-) Transcript_14258:279-1646(-)
MAGLHRVRRPGQLPGRYPVGFAERLLAELGHSVDAAALVVRPVHVRQAAALHQQQPGRGHGAPVPALHSLDVLGHCGDLDHPHRSTGGDRLCHRHQPLQQLRPALRGRAAVLFDHHALPRHLAQGLLLHRAHRVRPGGDHVDRPLHRVGPLANGLATVLGRRFRARGEDGPERHPVDHPDHRRGGHAPQPLPALRRAREQAPPASGLVQAPGGAPRPVGSLHSDPFHDRGELGHRHAGGHLRVGSRAGDWRRHPGQPGHRVLPRLPQCEGGQDHVGHRPHRRRPVQLHHHNLQRPVRDGRVLEDQPPPLGARHRDALHRGGALRGRGGSLRRQGHGDDDRHCQLLPRLPPALCPHPIGQAHHQRPVHGQTLPGRQDRNLSDLDCHLFVLWHQLLHAGGAGRRLLWTVHLADDRRRRSDEHHPGHRGRLLHRLLHLHVPRPSQGLPAPHQAGRKGL